jgi:two-component system response regulator MprA
MPITVLRVALVEDDPTIREATRRGLRSHGFQVRAAATGSEFLEMIGREAPDVMLIDVGLPDADGRDVAQAAAARGIIAPVVFLTARSAVSDRLSGFAAGADDYIIKPVVLEELVARLVAVARRAPRPLSRLGGLELDPTRMALIADQGVSVALTPTEYRICAALAAGDGSVVSRQLLVRAGWPHGSMVSENTLDSYVARIRRKLAQVPGTAEIRTVHGVGYSMPT